MYLCFGMMITWLSRQRWPRLLAHQPPLVTQLLLLAVSCCQCNMVLHDVVQRSIVCLYLTLSIEKLPVGGVGPRVIFSTFLTYGCSTSSPTCLCSPFWTLCLAPRIPYAQEKCSKCILRCHDDNLVTFRLQLCPTVSSCAKQQCCLRQGVVLAASSKLGQPGWLIGSVLSPGANSALPSNDLSTGACRARSEIKS
jgi:hypothetical protein